MKGSEINLFVHDLYEKTVLHLGIIRAILGSLIDIPAPYSLQSLSSRVLIRMFDTHQEDVHHEAYLPA